MSDNLKMLGGLMFIFFVLFLILSIIFPESNGLLIALKSDSIFIILLKLYEVSLK